MLLLLAAVLFVTGCEKSEEPSKGTPFTLSICLPVEDTFAPAYAPRRVPGDPGTKERFLLPSYVYIVIMKKPKDEAEWSLWESYTLTPDENDWTKTRYVGAQQTDGDSIYQYNAEIHELLASDRFDGRIYIIASAKELSFNKTLDDDPTTGLNSLADIEGLQFSAASTEVQQHLQHIYSTPYNYEMEGHYYGFFAHQTKVVSKRLMLYHVATKVDITWNVADNVRIKANPADAVRLTYMEARRLFNGDAYCFKPMRNELAALPTTGYTIADIVQPADEGLWWEGRAYFYTIPYVVTGAPGYFPLQMRMCTNGTDVENAYRPTLNLPIDTSATFVPWLRVNFNFSAPLADREETKIVKV